MTALFSTMLSVRQSLYELSAGIEGSFKFITDIGISTEKYSEEVLVVSW